MTSCFAPPSEQRHHLSWHEPPQHGSACLKGTKHPSLWSESPMYEHHWDLSIQLWSCTRWCVYHHVFRPGRGALNSGFPHTSLQVQKLLGSGHDRLFDAWLRKFSPLVKDRVLENGKWYLQVPISRPDGVPIGIRELELQEQTIANAGKDQVWQVQTSISHHPVNFSRPGFPLEDLAKDIKSRWASLQSHSANHNHGALFWRLHCVETNLLEGTFALTREVSLLFDSLSGYIHHP